jgi:hypothetical protein
MMSNKQIGTLRVAIAIGVVFLVGGNGTYTSDAYAEKFREVKLKLISKDDLQEKCKKAGGTFGEIGADYSCTTKGGSVHCNDKSCTGFNKAAQRTPKTLGEVLKAQ